MEQTPVQFAVEWPLARRLDPVIRVVSQCPDGVQCRIEPDLTPAYAWFDACEQAAAENRAPPRTRHVMRPEQVATIEAVLWGWPQLLVALRQRFPDATFLEWREILFSADCWEGWTYVRLMGVYEHLAFGQQVEGYVEAVVHGQEILAADEVNTFAERGSLSCATPHVPRAKPERRPHPDYIPLDGRTIAGHLERGEWAVLRKLSYNHPDSRMVSEAVWSLLAESPTDEQVQAVSDHLRAFSRHWRPSHEACLALPIMPGRTKTPRTRGPTTPNSTPPSAPARTSEATSGPLSTTPQAFGTPTTVAIPGTRGNKRSNVRPALGILPPEGHRPFRHPRERAKRS